MEAMERLGDRLIPFWTAHSELDTLMISAISKSTPHRIQQSSVTLLSASVHLLSNLHIHSTDIPRLIIYRGAPFALTEPVLAGIHQTPLNIPTNKQHAARYQGAFPV